MASTGDGMRANGLKGAHVGLTFHNPVAFWGGTAALTIGVLLHLPEFFRASDTQYQLAGMPVSGSMILGMVLIVGGVLSAGYGLFPRKTGASGAAPTPSFHLKAMDDAQLSPAHFGLLFVLGVALIIDVMKPATLGFIVPGMREEYGLSNLQVAIFPVSALTGTVIGSLFWGILSDRLGRRAAILLSSIMFVGTSICGFMPSFGINVFMCLLMGMAAGGMLPIVYALMAESVPAAKRGWLVVLHGGMGTVGGYLAASGLATLLVPHFTWRILWLMNLPTGLLMLVLNRWIPESPRFLLQRGLVEQARKVMARYGVILEMDGRAEVPAPAVSTTKMPYAGMSKLFRRPFLPRTTTVVLYGLGYGVVNWGFITFLPTFLEDAGFKGAAGTKLLFYSSLLAVPGTVLVAYLYGLWSSKRTMITYACATVVALAGFALLPHEAAAVNRTLLVALVGILLIASGGVISMLSPYTAEVYPTYLRGTGSGLAAGSSKLGGVFGPFLAAALAGAAGLTLPALVMAMPMGVAAGVLAWKGVETRGRRLEDISEIEQPVPAAVADR
ncbi:MAG TPA: MFS transporter [Actinomycetota bacterium]|nr:MFS transporter [Actinomycetota bacterium]